MVKSNNSSQSNSKSEDTLIGHEHIVGGKTCKLCGKITKLPTPEPSQDSPLGQATSLDEQIDDILSPQIMNNDECFECHVNFKAAKEAINRLIDDKVREAIAKELKRIHTYHNGEFMTIENRIQALTKELQEK